MTSCIDGEEDIWVNKDGSGHATFKLTAPTLLFAKFGGVEKVVTETQEILVNRDELTLQEITTHNSGSKTTLQARVNFQDVREVLTCLQAFRDQENPLKKSDEEIFLGSPKLEIQKLEIQFSRNLDIRSLIPPEAHNPLTKKLLNDSQITYRLHLPTKVKTHNAHSISKNRKTLQWNLPVTELLSGPVEMKFTANIPNLTHYLTLAGGALLLVLTGGIFLRKHRQST